jgi:hypothetical protein
VAQELVALGYKDNTMNWEYYCIIVSGTPVKNTTRTKNTLGLTEHQTLNEEDYICCLAMFMLKCQGRGA